MILSREERSARKKMQVARLGAKGSAKYAEVYATQPLQVQKAAEQQALKSIEREAKDALKAAAIRQGDEAASLWSGANELSTV